MAMAGAARGRRPNESPEDTLHRTVAGLGRAAVAAVAASPVLSTASAWASALVERDPGRLMEELSRCDSGGALEAHASEANPERNQSASVPCRDGTRVVLAPPRGLRLLRKPCDYIHANFVRGPRRAKEWILTQGPMPGTLWEFWRLVWQERVSLIVMLCPLQEGSVSPYWNAALNQPVSFGLIRVRTSRIEARRLPASSHHSYFTELAVERGGEVRRVVHLTYPHWAAESRHVPDVGALLHFLGDVNREPRLFPEAPIVVHCSDGVGRSGALVLLDAALQALRQPGPLSVPALLSRLRYERFGCVASMPLYFLVHLAIAAALAQDAALVPDSNLRAQLRLYQKRLHSAIKGLIS